MSGSGSGTGKTFHEPNRTWTVLPCGDGTERVIEADQFGFGVFRFDGHLRVIADEGYEHLRYAIFPNLASARAVRDKLIEGLGQEHFLALVDVRAGERIE